MRVSDLKIFRIWRRISSYFPSKKDRPVEGMSMSGFERLDRLSPPHLKVSGTAITSTAAGRRK
jgi:hypothetical protein